ncbi:hypothetical protein AWC38_SpisGene4779 [Stylophora pistillata]|uniref:Uncharacterized protein n=1 Tax=Stylophora pistillata TaxID=50429 RepID=A0A2B4SPJ0_STYPI|nr:hypothetical protein AWC38_SpisGene4779 [Stylophora pistillata]
MASLVVKILCVVCMYGFGPLHNNFVHGATDSSLAWDIRIRETLNKLQTRPCWGRSRGSQCDDSIIVGMDTRKMRLFTAEGQKKSILRVVLPDRRQRRLTARSHRNDSYDAVFVLDPYPDTNFGHVVFIFLVDFDVNQTVCRNMNGVPVNTGRKECIRRAEKVHCKNRIAHRQVKCEINFIPLVHSVNDGKRKQLLHCHESLTTRQFASCGKRDVQDELSLPCNVNSVQGCSLGKRPKSQDSCSYTTCDHAVLVSGGWNPDANHPRYRRNLHQMWKLLHLEVHYKKEKIVTFFGQGQKEELFDGQRDNSFFASSPTGVKEYIKKLCRARNCADSITLYLTGPSTSDGALLFQDNGDGITDDSELYTPKQLLEDVKNCSATRLFIVADYSYSGAMINRITSRMRRHPDQFRNLVAISSSSWNEYSWKSEFTEAFVKQNKERRKTKCVADVFEEIKQKFHRIGALSTPQKTPRDGGKSNITYTTLSGRSCNETWFTAKMAKPCQLIPIDKWRRKPSQNDDFASWGRADEDWPDESKHAELSNNIFL